LPERGGAVGWDFPKKNLREEDVFRFSSKLVVGREGRLEGMAMGFLWISFGLGWEAEFRKNLRCRHIVYDPMLPGPD
jgi:hypothetical protein